MIGPNEQRTISREDIGLYHAIIIGAAYQLREHSIGKHPLQKSFFFSPLAKCIEQHPWLSVVVGDKNLDKSYYERVATIDLDRHISIISSDPDQDDTSAIENLIAANLDKPFTEGIPPWNLAILPLRTGEFFIAYLYSHTIGDGISGPCFHRTFLEALQEGAVGPVSSSLQTPAVQLPEPFDTSERLPISWSFLLKPLLATLLPAFVANLLGFRASASSTVEGTWTSNPMPFDDSTKLRSHVKLIEFDTAAVKNAIKVSRQHDAKLTGVLLQLISSAIIASLGDSSATNIVAQTAVNMRRAAGIPPDEMGKFVSGCYTTHTPTTSGLITDADWTAARDATQKLALASVTLHDQPIGLLRYAPSVRGWLLGKIGQERDCSVEMSNIGVFDGQRSGLSEESASVTKMVFAQPGHVVGPPICFNVASVKERKLVCTVTWHAGSLGLKESEEDFVERVCHRIKDGFTKLS